MLKNLFQHTLVLSPEERQNRLEEFHKGYDENILDENLRKEKTRVIATLSEYFNRDNFGR
jgi:N-formylglutamate amidohydrolase